MDDSVNAATLQLLEWLCGRPRTYRETMNAWRSTCPRLSVWEDAVIDGLVEVVDTGGNMDEAEVRLTRQGRSALDGARRRATVQSRAASPPL